MGIVPLPPAGRSARNRLLVLLEGVLVSLSAILGVVAFWILLASLAGCHDGCETEETRCHGSRVEVCSAEGDWETEMDCGDIDPPELGWTCCVDPSDGIHSCLPADECVDQPVEDGGF